MAKSASYENSLLKLLFNATAIANVADNASSSPLTNLYVALHTSDPGSGGTQSTNEISYTGYARVAVARSGSGWTITANSVSPNAAITFGQMTAGVGGSAAYASVGSLTSGAGVIYYSGALSPAISVSNGVTPQIAAGSTITET